MKRVILRMCNFASSLLLLAVAFILQAEIREAVEACPLRFGIFFGPERSRTPIDGRILLMISSDGRSEPRFQISDGPDTQLVFGKDVKDYGPEILPSSIPLSLAIR